MTQQFQLNTGNNPQICPILGGSFGSTQLVLAFASAPVSGTVTVEVMPVGGDAWLALSKATAVSVIEAPLFIRAAGFIGAVRVTFSSVSGGSGASLWVQQLGFPNGLYEGSAAVTTQSYTEANVKNGSQFSASSYFTGLTAAENIDIIVITGAKKVLIKAQYLALKDGGDILQDWYRDPVYTDGANISAGIYNQSEINPEATTIQLIGPTPTDAAAGNYAPNDATKPNVSDVGTKIQPTLVTLGITGQGSSSGSRSTITGLEHELDANSVYLFRRRFVANTASMFGFSTWFEGEPDLPL